ncbi:MAG: TIGR03759 family integrating conjugative element protein [Gammaproteobacteria bacterium]
MMKLTQHPSLYRRLLCGVFGVVCLVLTQASMAFETTETEKQSIEARKTQETDIQQHMQDWGITRDEWVRYETLMQGPRGIWTPNLTPLEVLGAHARTPQERRRIAELYVHKAYARKEAEIAYQREVSAAWKRLYPGRKLLEKNPKNKRQTSAISTPQKAQKSQKPRMALVVDAENCIACDQAIQQQIKHLDDDRVQALDVYVRKTLGFDKVLNQWAKTHNIPAHLVDSGRVTINHGDKVQVARVPTLKIRVNGQWQDAQSQ